VLGTRRAKAILRSVGALESVANITTLRRLWQPAKGSRS